MNLIDNTTSKDVSSKYLKVTQRYYFRTEILHEKGDKKKYVYKNNGYYDIYTYWKYIDNGTYAPLSWFPNIDKQFYGGEDPHFTMRIFQAVPTRHYPTKNTPSGKLQETITWRISATEATVGLSNGLEVGETIPTNSRKAIFKYFYMLINLNTFVYTSMILY